MGVKNYAPGAVFVNLNSEFMTTWNNVNIDLDEDVWTTTVASTGEITHTRNESRAGTVTITLPQTSADNKKLDGLLVSHDTVGTADEPMDIVLQIKDKWGKNLHVMTGCKLKKKPKAEYTKEPTDKEWAFVGEVTDNKNGSD